MADPRRDRPGIANSGARLHHPQYHSAVGQKALDFSTDRASPTSVSPSPGSPPSISNAARLPSVYPASKSWPAWRAGGDPPPASRWLRLLELLGHRSYLGMKPVEPDE